MRDAREYNFDGIVGPTHNYSGLSHGNIASLTHGSQTSNPREAALQGLEKMKMLFELGVPQAVLPPQERPSIPDLKRFGFEGTDHEVLARAQREAPRLLANCSSASCMWTANAATVAPSGDTEDAKVHFTAANLSNKLHRTIEAGATSRCLRAIFSDPAHFVHHEPLPGGDFFGDEGAANHTRFGATHGGAGVQFFVYGKSAAHPDAPRPQKYPARQTLEASQTIARLHRLKPEAVVFAQQTASVIDAGVFHNDVISVGNRDFLFFHEVAFQDPESVLKQLRESFRATTGQELRFLKVTSGQVSVENAVKSYLFNSQLVDLPDGKMALIAPRECENNSEVKKYLEEIRGEASHPIAEFRFPDLRQSMQNGGGPACLRLRVILTTEEVSAVRARVIFDVGLYRDLKDWVQRHYRDRLAPADLADPKLLEESRAALDQLTQLLKLGSIYPFQRGDSSAFPSR